MVWEGFSDFPLPVLPAERGKMSSNSKKMRRKIRSIDLPEIYVLDAGICESCQKAFCEIALAFSERAEQQAKELGVDLKALSSDVEYIDWVCGQKDAQFFNEKEGTWEA